MATEKVNKSEQKLVIIAVGLLLILASNIWGGAFTDMLRELLRHIF